eukprot:SM000074S21716  [mRNA]  locus=s74:620649:621084:- [translate_table: standard]
MFRLDEDPLLKEVLQEPIAFFGGLFAGLLRLDLTEEPLRNWLARTSEAAGISTLEIEASQSNEDGPVDITIE